MALILAVDHNESVNVTIGRPLTLLGHKVFTVSDVETALAWLNETSQVPDLFIIDVGLRNFGGLEFVQHLKAKESKKWEKIPILVQSSSQTMDLYQYCEGLIMKPYSAAELIRQVDLLLSSINPDRNWVG